ncbi:alpha/beta fold hydrolase [Streptomyces physcomitrii]|uniref:Alpha/beta hydrolase n=1 Tax=Streptomyces physcomitrii TaxID=2724184 RepID=A0ABX1H4T5_9ACTN|nr:alpha/beta hydrolase [Streptomyces physcomitrii]NKI43374.1 alpha/beta hydrolase [Streptomyces physcomitrii]
MSRAPHVTSGPFAPPEPRRRVTATSADGAVIHAEVHGPDRAPAVVLVHGWTCSTAFWAAQIRDLAADHRVIAYDQRGHGRTPQVPGGYRTELLADDLEAVLRATLAPGEQAVLAGHSMGGMTIMAAARRPALREHAAAALLASTGCSQLAQRSTVLPLREGRIRTRLTRQILAARLPLGPVTPLARAALRYATMGPGTVREKVEASARIVHACPTRARHDWGLVLSTLELTDHVADLAVPTAVVAGTADRLTPPVNAQGLVAVLPNCVGLLELPGVGHMSPIEAPEAVNDRIRELTTAYLPAKEAAA